MTTNVATRVTTRAIVSRADARRHRLKSRILATRSLRLQPGTKRLTLSLSRSLARKLRKVSATVEVVFTDGTQLTRRVRIGS